VLVLRAAGVEGVVEGDVAADVEGGPQLVSRESRSRMQEAEAAATLRGVRERPRRRRASCGDWRGRLGSGNLGF
jgi:hypothetical protein